MKAAVQKIFREARDLAEADRADLIGALISTLAPEKAAPLDDAWLAELDRRCEELDSGAVAAIPWSVVRDRVRRKYHTDG